MQTRLISKKLHLAGIRAFSQGTDLTTGKE